MHFSSINHNVCKLGIKNVTTNEDLVNFQAGATFSGAQATFESDAAFNGAANFQAGATFSGAQATFESGAAFNGVADFNNGANFSGTATVSQIEGVGSNPVKINSIEGIDDLPVEIKHAKLTGTATKPIEITGTKTTFGTAGGVEQLVDFKDNVKLTGLGGTTNGRFSRMTPPMDG